MFLVSQIVVEDINSGLPVTASTARASRPRGVTPREYTDLPERSSRRRRPGRPSVE